MEKENVEENHEQVEGGVTPSTKKKKKIKEKMMMSEEEHESIDLNSPHSLVIALPATKKIEESNNVAVKKKKKDKREKKIGNEVENVAEGSVSEKKIGNEVENVEEASVSETKKRKNKNKIGNGVENVEEGSVSETKKRKNKKKKVTSDASKMELDEESDLVKPEPDSKMTESCEEMGLEEKKIKKKKKKKDKNAMEVGLPTTDDGSNEAVSDHTEIKKRRRKKKRCLSSGIVDIEQKELEEAMRELMVKVKPASAAQTEENDMEVDTEMKERKRKKKKRHGSSECTKMDAKPLEDNSQDLCVKENHEEVNTGQKVKKEQLSSSENGDGSQSQLKSNLEMKVSNTYLGAPCPQVGTRRKLLILDLNGLLLDIVMVVPRGHKAEQKIGIKSVFKRPFCDDFLKFCFERFEVGVWTSRTKKNMDDVLDFLMADTKHKLLFCWDQSHCTMTGINTIGNRHKPLVCKELSKLWDKHEPSLPWEKGEYNESNTLLLDDSPYKALLNLPNTAIFPYSYSLVDRNDNSLGPEGDIRLYLEGVAAAEDVQKYVKQHPFGQPAITNTSSSWGFYCRVFDNFKRQLN